MSNDNIPTEGPHHGLCLQTLQNIHDALDAAVGLDLQVIGGTGENDFMDLVFWRDQIALTLGKNPSHSLRVPTHSLRGH